MEQDDTGKEKWDKLGAEIVHVVCPRNLMPETSPYYYRFQLGKARDVHKVTNSLQRSDKGVTNTGRERA
jgi:hypothetical protein